MMCLKVMDDDDELFCFFYLAILAFPGDFDQKDSASSAMLLLRSGILILAAATATAFVGYPRATTSGMQLGVLERCPLKRIRLAGMLGGLRASDIKYGEMQHAGVLVQDVPKAVEFYTQVLGMRDESHLRPNLPYPGAFIGCGVNQIHLMQLPSPDPKEGRPEHGTRSRTCAPPAVTCAPA